MEPFRLRAALTEGARALGLAVLLTPACARPAVVAAPDAGDVWVRETLTGMSLQEKLGQMVWVRADGWFTHESDPVHRELVEAVREGRAGGVIFFRGDPFATAALANRLQEISRLPLLMSSDYEWGAAFRVEGATRFPSAMAVAAGGDEQDARFQGEVSALEARALGVHLALAPVLDINRNPANSVINYRSFGEDPERVSRLGRAFIEAAQERGLLTTAKHFPGHGATEVDSHVALPVIRLTAEEWESVDLPPFRQAVEAGVAAVMTAHVAVPALERGAQALPATFSPAILEGILRRDLGFRGLIVTDALDMRGAREGRWVGEAAVAAVKAGCDVLLMPPQPEVAWQSLRRAVERGEVSRQRVDASVSRILAAKARVNLHRQRTVDLRELARRVGDPRFRDRVQRIADRAITLLELETPLPLRLEQPPKLLLLSYVEEHDRAVDPSVLARALSERTETFAHMSLSSLSAEARAEEIERTAERFDMVVVASFARTRSSQGRGELPPSLVSAIDRMPASKPVVLAALGNPYVLTELRRASVLLAAYDFGEASQRAVARALFGEIDVSGKLPVSLSERYPVGHGIPLSARVLELEPAPSPEDVGMREDKLSAVLRVLVDAVTSKAFPGAVAIVGRRGKLVFHHPVGRLGYEKDSPRVTRDTLYDLASLTKVVATTTAAMILYEKGELDLLKPVRDYVPEFTADGKGDVRVVDLLAHCGGLLWWKDLYKDHSGPRARNEYLQDICRLPLDYPPRSKTVYSDLGIILLGEVLERVSGRALDEFVQKEVFEPLGMSETRFRPPASFLSRVAPTEQDSWRGRMVRGEVHDENAFALGGVAPHAGLFSKGEDLARFAQMLLNGGVYGRRRIVKRSTIERFTRRAERVPGSSRALGWDTPSSESSAGRYFSASSFGHTGFTGTSLWIDPERDLFAILLSNRVHPTRENPQIQKVRPAFHDAVMEAIDPPVAPRGLER